MGEERGGGGGGGFQVFPQAPPLSTDLQNTYILLCSYRVLSSRDLIASSSN